MNDFDREAVVRDFLLEAGYSEVQVDRMVRAAAPYSIVLQEHQMKTFGDALGAIVTELQKDPPPGPVVDWTFLVTGSPWNRRTS